jgi:hypothetical protein
MAKITPHRYECDFCEKPFTTAQGVRGHLRHCAYRRLRQQVGAQAEAEPPTVTERKFRRPGPDSQDSKRCLLDTYELIQQLRRDARDFAGIAYLLAKGNVRGQYEMAKEWLRLSQAVDDVERDFDLMVGPLRLDRSLLFRAYHQLGPIRDTWRYYRTRHLRPALEGEKEEEIPNDIREEEAMWATIMNNIKKMLAAST